MFTKYKVLIAGIASPFAALVLYQLVYGTLTRNSANLEADWRLRLTAGTVAMTTPFLLTLTLAVRDRGRNLLTVAGKVGLGIAALSLGLTLSPIHDGMKRSAQTRNLAMRDVAAPPFETTDVSGKPQRLADHKGEVVLVSIWATWCGPCRAEMPKLDQLYRARRDQGLMVFGISDEAVATQQKFLTQVPVSYPLLTVSDRVPGLYREIARYPAMFLIDRQGRLQQAPSPDQPFDKVQAVVDDLLAR